MSSYRFDITPSLTAVKTPRGSFNSSLKRAFVMAHAEFSTEPIN
jgi:hypothetical protein